MNNIPEVINNTLEVLSTKFGTSVEQLWQVMVSQQLIEAKAHLFIGILFSVMTIGFIIMHILMWKKDRNDDAFIPFFISIGLLAIALTFFYISYMEFANPQYQAIREFLGVIKGE